MNKGREQRNKREEGKALEEGCLYSKMIEHIESNESFVMWV